MGSTYEATHLMISSRSLDDESPTCHMRHQTSTSISRLRVAPLQLASDDPEVYPAHIQTSEAPTQACKAP